MIDIFVLCLKALKNYTGLKLLFALSLVAWFYLFFREKNKTIRVALVFMPFITMLVFICPLTYFVFDKVGLDTDIYYRMLWMIPFGILTVYAMVKFFNKNIKYRLLGLLLSSALIVFSGRLIYTCDIFFKSENVYGLPQQTLNVVDYLRSIDNHERITVLPSADLITTIRQYDATICMPYGRDMFNASLNYTHPVYEVYERAERLNFKELLKVSRDYEIEYFIVYAARLLEDDPIEAGLVYVGEVDDHLIYRDPVMSERIKLIEQYYGQDVFKDN